MHSSNNESLRPKVQDRACERSVSGAENGAEQAENRVTASEAVSAGLSTKRLSVSGVWRPQSGRGARRAG